MAKLAFPLAALFLVLLAVADAGVLYLTVVNNCPFTIWPAIQPNAGHPVLERGGFALPTLHHRSFLAPGAAAPATLAQFDLHHGGPQRDFCSYGVSLVDGFNVPMTVTPHMGRGVCPVVGCRHDLLRTCPPPLQVRSGLRGHVVACKSGCEAFRTDELCCRNHYNSPQTCRPSEYSRFFKEACPATFTFAHDSPSLMHDCESPNELKVIFCH
ncbi:PREDICTED: osmotin-like protein [Tarenaya hassleriana]|uniref:osmotin-like protein n=1 Tax=Tarenaya hassleriana TaxID=28532 RepID=UPI00053C1218|nr:PREDICTED: osmotin-like protein [Tarenaya hassleriana]